ncbi:MAG: response regulator [SAR324 cluster bacterium]|nr:response regulator [SAR324 cluster bacterium]
MAKNYPAPQILIVDDREENLFLTQAILKSLNIQIYTASSGKRAIEIAHEQDLALVLLDIQMPDLDGFEIAARIREHDLSRNVPIIFITAIFREDHYIFKGYEHGAVDFLSKPFDPYILESKVRIFVSLYEQRRDLALKTAELNEALSIQYMIADNAIRTAEELKTAKQKLEETNSELIASRLEQEKTTKMFQVFVPKQFLQRIYAEGVDFLTPGYCHQEVLTILFSDIRSYTRISEQMTPRKNFEFLNEYLTMMEPLITDHGGFIDKFIGDGIMALFDRENSVNRAIQSAIEMHRAIQHHNAHRSKEFPPIHFGVGINTGAVVVGALGTINRMDSTVVGDHVNISARLEQLTKQYKAGILITGYSHAEINDDDYAIREIDTVKIRGKGVPVTIFEVFDHDPPEIYDKKQQTKAFLFEGIIRYKSQHFEDAIKLFEKCEAIYPDDVITREYLQRCRYFLRYPPEDYFWDGVVEETSYYLNQQRRRRTPRFDVYTPARLFMKQNMISGIALDISRFGMRMELEEPLTVGETTIAEIVFLPEKDGHAIELDPIQIICKVIWQKNSVKKDYINKWTIGLEFLMLSATQESDLIHAVKQITQTPMN